MDRDLKEAFLDVRKAYRLLHGYHTRVIDTARMVGDLLAPAGKEWEFWMNPTHTTPFSSGRRLLTSQNWVWDATPLIGVSFLWVKHERQEGWEKIHGEGDALLGMEFIADSGFRQQLSSNKDKEPLPESMGDPAQAKTEVRLAVIVRASPSSADVSWYDLWRDKQYPKERGETVALRDGHKMYSRLYDAIDFASEDAIRAICAAFKEQCVSRLQPSPW